MGERLTPPFSIQKYLSRGSATPCVARTMLQTSELVGAFPLTEDQRKKIVDVSHAVMLKLVACLDAAEPVLSAIKQGKERIRAGNLNAQAGDRVVELPSVPNLRASVETFLYNAKQALRDIAGLFQPFYGQTFDHRYQKVRAWLVTKFGSDDPLVKDLDTDAGWIETVISMRNSVDHPATGDGILYVHDFRFVQDGDQTKIAEPAWHQDEKPPASIEHDLESIQYNLLTLFEDLLTDSLTRLVPNGPVIIVEIPEDQRDPQKPIRFRTSLNMELPS